MVSETKRGESEEQAAETALSAAPAAAPMFSSAGYIVLLVIVLIEGIGIYAVMQYTHKSVEPAKVEGTDLTEGAADRFLDLGEVETAVRGVTPELTLNLRLTISFGIEGEEAQEHAKKLIAERKPILLELIRRAMADVVTYADVTSANHATVEERLKRRILTDIDAPMEHLVKAVAIPEFRVY